MLIEKIQTAVNGPYQQDAVVVLLNAVAGFTGDTFWIG